MNKIKLVKNSKMSQVVVKGQKMQRIHEGEINVINNNQAQCLLKVSVVNKMAAAFNLVYNVTGFVPFKEYLKTPAPTDKLVSILKNILVSLQSIQKAKLNMNNVVFDGNFVMVNPATGDISFVYVPIVGYVNNENLRDFILGIMQFETAASDVDHLALKRCMAILNRSSSFSSGDLKECIKVFAPNESLPTGDDLSDSREKASVPVVTRRCAYCGKDNTKNTLFCSVCGSKLDNSVSEPKSVVPRPNPTVKPKNPPLPPAQPRIIPSDGPSAGRNVFAQHMQAGQNRNPYAQPNQPKIIPSDGVSAVVGQYAPPMGANPNQGRGQYAPPMGANPNQGRGQYAPPIAANPSQGRGQYAPPMAANPNQGRGQYAPPMGANPNQGRGQYAPPMAANPNQGRGQYAPQQKPVQQIHCQQPPMQPIPPMQQSEQRKPPVSLFDPNRPRFNVNDIHRDPENDIFIKAQLESSETDGGLEYVPNPTDDNLGSSFNLDFGVMCGDEWDGNDLMLEEDAGTVVLDEAPTEKEAVAYLKRLSTGDRVVIDKPCFTVGRMRSKVDYCVMNNSAVGRRHVNIITKNGRYFICDLESTNGTFVDDREIPENVETEIFDGTRIALANEGFEFYIE